MSSNARHMLSRPEIDALLAIGRRGLRCDAVGRHGLGKLDPVAVLVLAAHGLVCGSGDGRLLLTDLGLSLYRDDASHAQ